MYAEWPTTTPMHPTAPPTCTPPFLSFIRRVPTARLSHITERDATLKDGMRGAAGVPSRQCSTQRLPRTGRMRPARRSTLLSLPRRPQLRDVRPELLIVGLQFLDRL